MKLTWYGTAALIFEEENRRLVFDPFCGIPESGLSPQKGKLLSAKQPFLFPAYAAEFRRAQEIFVTHGHFDHIHHIPLLYKNRQVQIHCTKTPYKTLHKHGIQKNQLQQISPGFTGIYGPFLVRAFHGKHCHFDLPLLKRTICRKQFFRYPLHLFRLLALLLQSPQNGEILFYEISSRGLRIQIMGSMNLDPSVCYPTGADFLILALQGRSDQNTYALQFVERLKPKAILLDHYDNTFPPLTDEVDVSGFVENVKKTCSVPCIPLVRGKTIDLTTLH